MSNRLSPAEQDSPVTAQPELRPTETTVPVLHCVSAEETLEFYQALGFRVTWRQTRPYLYLAFAWSGFELHFGDPPKNLNPDEEATGGCLVMVDEVAPYHAALTAAMRKAYGKVLARGRPRITRYRPGATRFSVIDPSGNTIIFIQRGEPAELPYGGSEGLHGIRRGLDIARVYREFKHEDEAAMRAVKSALRRHGGTATPVERALAYATLIELATALDRPEQALEWTAALRAVTLSVAERDEVEAELGNAANLARWLDGDATAAG